MNKVKQKRDYVRWFLNFRLKNPKAAKLLINISHNSHILDQVIFVDDITANNNALLISARGTRTFPFLCKINGLYYSNPDDILEIINQLPENEPLYICLAYPERPVIPELLDINSAVDDDMVKSLQQIWLNIAQKEILQEIDIALDKNDKKEFVRLTRKLRQING